jgi:hypothetical protein
MKRYISMLILMVAVWATLAASPVAGIPVSGILANYSTDDLNGAMRQLSDQGYGILHYDAQYAIATLPGNVKPIPGTKVFTIPVNMPNLYLAGKVPGAMEIASNPDWQVLLELDSAWLLASGMDETQLRAAIINPFTLLGPEPLRFPDPERLPGAAEAARTDINQMLALVNATSVQNLIQGLQDFQTRFAFADNHQQVAEWIRQQFVNFGVTNAQLQPFSWQNTTQYNVVATITGTTYPDQYIIVGGHHDSISNNSDPLTFAPGADDNASGTVAALEMARVMMQSGYQPRTSIRFVTFAAEEFGLWGGKYYANTAHQNGQNIRLMINHDMIANQTGAGPWQVRLMPYDGSMEHSAYATQITEQYTDLDAYYGSLNSGSSDSHPFWQNGFNVIYFFESEFSPVYHSDQDIMANINPAYCAEVVKASVACAATFADMPAPPYDLMALDTGTGNSLMVTWNGYDDPNIAGYKIYRATSLQGPWSDPVQTTETNYTATGLTEGQLYYFALSSIDIFGNESYWVYTSGTPLSVPLQPQNFHDQPIYQAINLDWDPNLEMDLAGYRLYRSQTEGVLGDQIGGLITDDNYLDNAVQGSTAYYYYTLCAVDLDGHASSFTQAVSSRPATLDQGILIVDETEDMSGANPFQPTDQQADDFYAAATQGFGTTTQLDLADLAGDLRLADIGIFSSILWHGNDQASMDTPYFAKEILQQYIQLGGNFFFSVYTPSLAFDLNSDYPAYFDSDTFIYSVIGIGEADYENTARFKTALPVHDQFPEVEIDPAKTSPTLNGHIFRVESIGPNPDCATVYNYGSDYAADSPQGAMNDMPVGVLNMNNSGKVCVVSFPLYNIYQDDARDLVEYVFTEYFNENVSNDDPGNLPCPVISLGAGHPNPFSGSTSFRVETKDASLPIDIQVFNLRGQLVKTVFSGNSPRSAVFAWDGSDGNGQSASSGIYILRATQGGTTAQKRLVLIK